MLSNGEKAVVLAVLHLQRKSGSNVTQLADDERDLNEIFEALAACGYQVLPKGIVDGLKKTLARLK